MRATEGRKTVENLEDAAFNIMCIGWQFDHVSELEGFDYVYPLRKATCIEGEREGHARPDHLVDHHIIPSTSTHRILMEIIGLIATTARPQLQEHEDLNNIHDLETL